MTMNKGPKFYQSDLLVSSSAEHGFFTRLGGVSSGIFESLNIGGRQGDEPSNTVQNKTIIAGSFGLPLSALKLASQVHGNGVAIIDETNSDVDFSAIEADGLVTKLPHIILGINTADCCPLLFLDDRNHIIGIAHAGWRGAFSGIIPATLAAMVKIGADDITAIKVALGPAISQSSYEVDEVFRDRFISQRESNLQFFSSSARHAHHYLFDLKAYVKATVVDLGIREFHDVGLDTYAMENEFFSCRRAYHASPNLRKFGVQFSGIVLKDYDRSKKS